MDSFQVTKGTCTCANTVWLVIFVSRTFRKMLDKVTFRGSKFCAPTISSWMIFDS